MSLRPSAGLENHRGWIELIKARWPGQGDRWRSREARSSTTRVWALLGHLGCKKRCARNGSWDQQRRVLGPRRGESTNLEVGFHIFLSTLFDSSPVFLSVVVAACISLQKNAALVLYLSKTRFTIAVLSCPFDLTTNQVFAFQTRHVPQENRKFQYSLRNNRRESIRLEPSPIRYHNYQINEVFPPLRWVMTR